MNFYYSPLRYPGGKSKISEYVIDLIINNNMRGCVYIEPFAGGASVALRLIMDDVCSKAIINDKDRSIYAFWYSVKYYNNELCELIQKTQITVDEWYNQKEIQKNKETADLLSLGFSTFFLNRVNRSGILIAGIIGGKNQSGEYLMSARFNKIELINRIKRISHISDKLEIYNLDAIDFINEINSRYTRNCFYYLDPPYYVKGKGLYMNYYTDNDHKDILNAVKKLSNHKWIISYDNVDFIRNLYNKFRTSEFFLNYFASSHSKGKEVLIYCDNMTIANTDVLRKVSQ